MNFTITQSALNQLLDLVKGAINRNPTHPILSNVLLTADEKTQNLNIKAFDLNIGIEGTMPCTVVKSGTTTAPHSLLSEIVKKLSSDISISIEEGDKLKIKSGSSNYTVSGLPPEEFPEFPTIDTDAIEMPLAELKAGVKLISVSISEDESKRVLTGGHLTSNSNGLEFAGTDGHRLTVAKSLISDCPDIELTIPSKALAEVIKLNDTSPTVKIRYDQSQIVFELEDRSIMSRLLDGAYVNYNQLIPNQFERFVVCDRKLLISAIERVSTVLDAKNNLIKCEFDSESQELTLSSKTQDKANSTEAICVQFSGESLVLAFNSKYLVEGLKIMESKEVKLSINTATSPVVITPIGGTELVYLLMPIQIWN